MYLPILSPITSSSFYLPLCSSITLSFFYSRLKTYLFHKSYPSSFASSSQNAFTDYCLGRFFWAARFLFLVSPYLFVTVPCATLGWPSRQLCSARKYTVSYRIASSLNYPKFSSDMERRAIALCVSWTCSVRYAKLMLVSYVAYVTYSINCSNL